MDYWLDIIIFLVFLGVSLWGTVFAIIKLYLKEACLTFLGYHLTGLLLFYWWTWKSFPFNLSF